jgi:phosphoserine aminotransferase
VRKNNVAKAGVLYDAIEASGGFYNSPVAPEARSKMNVPFTIPSNPDLEKAFVSEATAAGAEGGAGVVARAPRGVYGRGGGAAAQDWGQALPEHGGKGWPRAGAVPRAAPVPALPL